MPMRLWVESYARTTRVSSSALVSIVAHAVLIGAAAAATRRPPALAADWIENRAYYLPPPNHAASQEESREALEYIALAPEGFGAGATSSLASSDQPIIAEPSASLGDIGRDLTSSIEAPKLAGTDSIFTQLEVDSTVSRFPGSAAPLYPVAMLNQGLQGSVLTQYVVDTTGYADTSSLKIVRATHAAFADAVRAALPYMRFFPAKIGPKRVRQLVEQEFSFKIDQAATKAARRDSSPDKYFTSSR